MIARFDENPAMTLRVIKETKRYGRTHAHTDGGGGAMTAMRTYSLIWLLYMHG